MQGAEGRDVPDVCTAQLELLRAGIAAGAGEWVVNPRLCGLCASRSSLQHAMLL